MNSRPIDAKVSRLLADNYSQRILSYTYKRPMSAQRLSKICKIPIAACYRRIHELEKTGLITVADEKEIYKGRKVKLYRCRLRSAALRFSGGKFRVSYDTLPDNDGSDTGVKSEQEPCMQEEPSGASTDTDKNEGGQRLPTEGGGTVQE